MDALGFIRLVDRTKDLVKSGGEWISSVELESIVLDHVAIAEAAVVAMPDARWGERTCMFAVPVPGADPPPDTVLDFLSTRVAKWWLPDRVEFVDEIPKTSVGKIDKALRATVASWNDADGPAARSRQASG